MSDWAYIEGFYTTDTAKNGSIYIPSIRQYVVPVYVAKRDATPKKLWEETVGDVKIIYNGLIQRTCYDGWQNDVYPCSLIPDGKCTVICIAPYKMENSCVTGISDYKTPIYLFYHAYPDLHTAMALSPECNSQETGIMITMIINHKTKDSMFRVNDGCWAKHQKDVDTICVRPVYLEEYEEYDDLEYSNPEVEFVYSNPQDKGSIALKKGSYYVIVANDTCTKILDTYSCFDLEDVRKIVSKYICSKKIHWDRSDILGYNPMYLIVGTDYDVQRIFVYDKNLELLEEI